MVSREESGKGCVRVTPLANFTARIARDVVLDDGAALRREFGLEVQLDGQKVTFTIPAAEFGRMGWVLQRLGPRAIIYPGQQQHARAAIQWFSREIQQEHVFTHLGWRQECEQWLYLHRGGAIGSGAVRVVQVRLPAALQQYGLRQPENADALVGAVRASLRLLAVAPDRISLPLLATVYRAPFGMADFSVFLAGQTGAFKSALAGLCQQHFGADMDGRHLPANFAATENALETLAFYAKDTLLVVDDLRRG
jgi:hypothetical protein